MASSKVYQRRLTRLITVSLAVVILVALASVIIDRQTRPVLTSGPLVQIPEAGQLVIVWGAKTYFDDGVVHMPGAAQDWPGDDWARAVRRPDGRYEAAFKELPAGAELDYTVFNRTYCLRSVAVAGPNRVAVPPARGKPFRFLAFGDSGVGSNAQAALAGLMAEQNPDLIIHAGDLDQSNGDPRNYVPNFFEPYAALIRSVPFMPVLGNHDCATDRGKGLLDIFVLPRNGPVGVEPERYYWFDFGDARFVGLDGNKLNESHGGVLTAEQMKTVVAPWLRGVLSDCDARWKFVYFHQPIYTGSEHPASGSDYLKDAYAAVFDGCGVDMAFSGHNHLYERTAPIRGDQIAGEGEGVVYITTGAGGAARYPEKEPPPEYMRVYYDEALSFTQVDVSSERLELRQINSRGEVVDEYRIDKSLAASQTAGRAPQ